MKSKQLFLSIIISLTSFFSYAQSSAATYEWIDGYKSDSLKWIYEMVVDSGGNTYSVGRYVDTLDFDSSPSTLPLD